MVAAALPPLYTNANVCRDIEFKDFSAGVPVLKSFVYGRVLRCYTIV